MPTFADARSPHGLRILILGICLLVLTVVYVQGPLSSHATVEASWINIDHFTYYFPKYDLAWDRWRHGQPPLWNPYQQCGTPIVPTLQAGVFYPGNIAFLFLSTANAMRVTAILHIALTGLLAAWYVNRLGVGIPGMAAAAILGAFGSDVIQRFWVSEFLHASPWIFACLIAMDALLERPSLRAAAGLALAYGMQFLGGWPQCAVLTGYVLAGRLAWQLLAGKRAASITRIAGALAVAVVLWAAVSAIQLLPTAQLLPYSLRNPEGLSAADVEGSGLAYSPERLLFDSVDGAPSVRLKKPYVGAIGIVLLLLAWRHKTGRRDVTLWWLVFAAATIMAMGFATPLYRIFYAYIPTGRWFRDPPRFLYIAHTAATILVAFGAEAFVQRASAFRVRHRRRLFTIAALGLVICLLLALYGTRETGARLDMPALGVWLAAMRPWGLWLGCVVTGVLFVLLRPSRSNAETVALLLGIVWIADLFHANRNMHAVPWTRPDFLIDRAVLGDMAHADVAGPRLYVISDFLDFELNPKLGSLWRIPQVDDYENLHQGRHSRFFYFEEHGTPAPPDLLTAGRTPLTANAAYPHLLDLLSVRWIAVRTDDTRTMAQPAWPQPLPEGFVDTTTPVAREHGILLAENERALPRTYVAYDAEAVQDETQALQRLTEPRVLRGEAVVLDTETLPNPTFPSANPPQAAIESYQPERVEISVITQTPGWLVLTDSWYPGWKAFVNNAATEIVRANVLVRAVWVPGGQSRVVFEFSPTIQYVGAALTLAGLFVSSMLLRPWRVRR